MKLKKLAPEIEEKLTTFLIPNNGSSPFWSYGTPTIVRYENRVYATVPETSTEALPTCNTRLQLFCKEGEGAWEKIFVNPEFDQREPCPIGSMGDGRIMVSINPRVAPFRGNPASAIMWYCEPYLLEFDVDGQNKYPAIIKPKWDMAWPFTDHSYRGLSIDRDRKELFVMNIEGYQWKEGPQGRFHWAFLDKDGGWAANGLLEFPVRACYPCISLKDRAVHLVAISDIDEPNQEWMAYKRHYTGENWDFDFRILYYTSTDDIVNNDFAEPVVIEDHDSTAGHIKHLDLYVDSDNIVHVLYIARNIWKPFMRDKFWPAKRLFAELKVARLKDGQVLDKTVIARCSEDPDGDLWSFAPPTGEKNAGESFRTNDFAPKHGAFHVTPSGRLFVLYSMGGFDQAGIEYGESYLKEIGCDPTAETIKLAVEEPSNCFFVATPRTGSSPSEFVDLMGMSLKNPNQINYLRFKITD